MQYTYIFITCFYFMGSHNFTMFIKYKIVKYCRILLMVVKLLQILVKCVTMKLIY
jgi:hypothetical protein